MKRYLRLMAGMTVLVCLAIRAAAQDGDDNREYRILLDFSGDIARYNESGNSPINALDAFGYNFGLIWREEKGILLIGGVARPADEYEAEPPPTTKWHPGIDVHLQYVSKGAKFDGQTSHSNYLELTGLAELDAGVGEGTAFFRLGPFLGYGVGGKSGSGAYEVATFGGQNGFRRFDAGPAFGLGYEFSFGGVIYLSYELGLVNRAPVTTDGFPTDYKDYTRAAGLNFAYPIDKIITAFKK